MKRKSPPSVSLNQADFLNVVMNRVFPSLGQMITIRFKTKHSPDEIRHAMRRILSLYDRLRLYVRPALFSHRIFIYDDGDSITEKYFNGSFRVIPGVTYDSPGYREYRRKLLNEPFSLKSGLPLTVSYFPDDPEPVLLLSVHHLVCDGMGWIHMVDALMAILNGKNPPLVPLEDPSHTAAILEKPYYRFPLQLVRSYRKYKETVRERKNDRVFLLSHRHSDTFGPCDMHQQYLAIDLAALKEKANEMGCTINVLIFAALAIALRKRAAENTGNAAHIYFYIDLRPFFDGRRPIYGNFVTSAIIRVEEKLLRDYAGMIREIKAQLERNVAMVRNRDIIYPFLLNKLSTLMGVRLYRRLVHHLKKKGTLYPWCIFSNLGNVDRLNSHGTHARLTEVLATVAQMGIFLTASSIDGRMSTNVSYPSDEFTSNEIREFIRTVEESLGEILKG
jgi:hypothetical protein